MQHIFSLSINYKPGIMIRAALIFERRGFEVDFMEISGGDSNGLSKMIIRANGDSAKVEQIEKQLEKLIDVVSAKYISSELAVDKALELESKPALLKAV
jgi:acetolactate synthase-1/3 small subunit